MMQQQPISITQPMSSVLRAHLFLLFFTSAYVQIEPAPMDVLFVYVFVLNMFIAPFLLDRSFALPSMFAVGYAVFSIPSLFRTNDGEHAALYYSITIYLFVLSIYVAVIVGQYGKKVLRPAILAICLSAVIFTAIAMFGMFGVLPFRDMVMYGDVRFKGFFKDPNVYGPVMDSIFMLILNYVLVNKRYMTTLMPILFMVLLASALTLSRSAWAGLVVMLAVYFGLVFMFSRTGKVGVIMTLVAVVPLLFSILLFVAGEVGYLQWFDARMGYQHYDDQRFGHQEILLREGLENFWGHGPGSSDESMASHSTYVRLIYENGILALICFVLFNLYILSIGFKLSMHRWQYQRFSMALLSILTFFVLNGFTVDTIHWRHMFVYMGIFMGLNVLFEKTKRTQSQGVPLHLIQY